MGTTSFMRKQPLFAAILLFISTSLLQAQVKYGFKGGLNLSEFLYGRQYSDDEKGSGSSLPRFNAGMKFEIPLNDDDDWYLYTGPGYSGKGNRIRAHYPAYNFDTITTWLNYIELPVSVGYKFPEGSEKKVSAAAGIYAAYGFNGRVVTRNSPERTLRHLHRKENIYKRIETGFSVSAMLEIKNQYGISVDYARSVFDISRRERKEYNNVFGFSFFWYLPNSTKRND